MTEIEHHSDTRQVRAFFTSGIEADQAAIDNLEICAT